MIERQVFLADPITSWIDANIAPFFKHPLVALFALVGAGIIFGLWKTAKQENDEPDVLWKGVAIVLVILVAYSNIFAAVPGTIVGPGEEEGEEGVGISNTYQITGVVQDFDTGSSLGGTSAKVDVIDPNAWDKPLETITVDTTAKTFTSAKYYLAGEVLYFHIYSTEGNGYYDSLQGPLTVPSVSTGGTTPKWDLGTFYLKNRVAAGGLSMVLVSPTGTSLSSGTGSAAGSLGQYTATGKSFTLKVNIYLSAYSVHWGAPMETLGTLAPYPRETRQLVMWIACNNTAVSQSALTARGFIPISNQPPGWFVMYMVLPEVKSDRSTLGSATVDMPIDTTAVAANKNVSFYVYFADLQKTLDASAGVYDGAPTAYGAFSAYGLTALMPATGYYQTSSNVPNGAWLSVKIKTA